jgi:hypothetical protein
MMMALKDYASFGYPISDSCLESVLGTVILSGRTDVFRELLRFITGDVSLELSSEYSVRLTFALMKHSVDIKAHALVNHIYQHASEMWVPHAQLPLLHKVTLLFRIQSQGATGQVSLALQSLQEYMSLVQQDDSKLIRTFPAGTIHKFVNAKLAQEQDYRKAVWEFCHFFRGDRFDSLYTCAVNEIQRIVCANYSTGDYLEFMSFVLNTEKALRGPNFSQIHLMRTLIDKGLLDQASSFLHQTMQTANHNKGVVRYPSEQEAILLLLRTYLGMASKTNGAIAAQLFQRALRELKNVSETRGWLQITVNQLFIRYFESLHNYPDALRLCLEMFSNRSFDTQAMNTVLLVVKHYSDWLQTPHVQCTYKAFLTARIRKFAVRCYEEILCTYHNKDHLYARSGTDDEYTQPHTILQTDQLFLDVLDNFSVRRAIPDTFTHNLILSFLLRYVYTQRALSLFRAISLPRTNTSLIFGRTLTSPPDFPMSAAPDNVTYHLLITYFCDRFSLNHVRILSSLYESLVNNSLLIPLRTTLVQVFFVTQFTQRSQRLAAIEYAFTKYKYSLPLPSEEHYYRRRWKGWLRKHAPSTQPSQLLLKKPNTLKPFKLSS